MCAAAAVPRSGVAYGQEIAPEAGARVLKGRSCCRMRVQSEVERLNFRRPAHANLIYTGSPACMQLRADTEARARGQEIRSGDFHIRSCRQGLLRRALRKAVADFHSPSAAHNALMNRSAYNERDLIRGGAAVTAASYSRVAPPRRQRRIQLG